MTDRILYRPANATIGDAFMTNWCEGCAFNGASQEPCGIPLASQSHQVDQEGYPDEWVYVGHTPTCTAFRQRHDEEAPSPRCDQTPDLFRELV